MRTSVLHQAALPGRPAVRRWVPGGTVQAERFAGQLVRDGGRVVYASLVARARATLGGSR
jgi:hypothetical protein